MVKITVGSLRFTARLETKAAPKTCVAFQKLLPIRATAVQARWSGEAVWVPLGERDWDLRHENHTSYPIPGQLLLYPGGLSEVEILIAYGATRFASKAGQLAGNHFATIEQGMEQLAELGRRVGWEGAQEIRFEEA
jgi:hypothetical protein